ncbi:MAG: universal stress protein [Candidatus Nitricoxidivorans perseverans]|uniref:Universal stress protein n=1 Tax=Candidatus Nitricoxidivorans perseverans TaxID=2975601 RepID=A0AA49IWS6_9PROT|nr:MAG: universal stress protein [Candidatus Nitricoxidivorans perseverans]
MKTPFHILAATDFSAPSRHAVDRAFRLAAESGAQVTLMHAIQQRAIDELRSLLGHESEPIVERIRQQAHDVLSQLIAERGQARGVSAAAHLAAGNVLRVIVAHADAIDADLLVVGARGEGFLRYLWLGSTAARLLRLTRRPTLVVKQAPHEPYRRILVPVDFSPGAAAALRLARTLAPDAQIVLLHAFEAPFEGKLAFAGVEEALIQHYRARAKDEALQQLHSLAIAAGLTPTEASLRALGDVSRGATYQKEAQDKALRQLHSLATASLGSTKATLLALHGDPSRLIVEQEQEQDCDLIVMGKHGQDMIEEFLLGSVTKHVLAESQGDVLVTG